MGRRITLLLSYFGVALGLALSPFASFAQPVPPSEPVFSVPGGLPPLPDDSHGDVALFVELASPPAVASNDTPSQRMQRIATMQSTLLGRLAATGARVLYQARVVANGIAVVVPAAQIDIIRQLPGVARVAVIPPKALDTTATGANNAVLAAQSIAAATGRGVRIGVIDRGIDYTHADFGGAGTPSAYTANNPTLIEPNSFPTAKVVGGYDFAGDSYDANGANGSVVPTPDADPLECDRFSGTATTTYLGRATHIAGLAAGMGVAADGSTYRGPYGPGVDYSALRIAPGVAPEATLYALKIFGCQGTSALMMPAIERALDPNGDGDTSDHLDVLLVLVGTPFGSPDDPDVQAIETAVHAGVVVVVAAGDTIGTFYSVQSTAEARGAIAVGASDGRGSIAPFSARGPNLDGSLKPDIVAPGVGILSADIATGSEGATRSGTSIAASQVAGAAAILRQVHPQWSPAAVKAALMNSATAINAPPSLAGAGELNVAKAETLDMLAYNVAGNAALSFGAPWVAASTTATRTLVLQNLGTSDQVVRLSATAVATETGVTVNLPTTEITVPAGGSTQTVVRLGIDAAGLPFTPDGATTTRQQPNNLSRHYLAEHGGEINISSIGGAGTRVRPGHAAHFGSVDFYLDDVLLDDSLDSREVQQYVNTTPGAHTVYLRNLGSSPSSTPLFSAPVNLLDGRDYTLLVIGRPDALAILPVDDTVSSAPPAGQSLIHFVNANRVEPNWDIGPLKVYLDGLPLVPSLAVGATSDYQTIASGTHTVEFYKVATATKAEDFVARKIFTVASGEAVLVGTGRHDDNDGDLADDEQRAFVGIAPIREASRVLAAVPYSILPTLASSAHVDPASIVRRATAFSATVRNSGARNAGAPGGMVSPRTPLATAFQLVARSPQQASLAANARAADLQYVGITSNYSATGDLSKTFLYFGIASYAPWSTPNQVQFRVYIDSNRDGTDDYAVVSSNWASALSNTQNDVFVDVLYPLLPNGTMGPAYSASFWGSFPAPIESGVNMAPFNTSVAMQTVRLRDLAVLIDPANPLGPKGAAPANFCYRIETRARVDGRMQIIDRVPSATATGNPVCANRPGMLFADVQASSIAPINTTTLPFSLAGFERPIFLDIDGGQITGSLNTARITAQGGAELLVLHHHNAPYPRAEVIPLSATPAFAATSSQLTIPMVSR